MKTYGNIVTRYDDMLYDSRPVQFNEFISDKYNNVHNELYNDAINKFLNEYINEFIDSKFIYSFFRLMENKSDSIETLYAAYQLLDNDNPVKKTIEKLSINAYEFLEIIFNKTSEILDALKETIINYNVIDHISNENDINDFRIIYSINNTYLKQEDDDPIDGDSQIQFYTYTKSTETDSDISIYHITTEYMFLSELEDYVIILEAENGTRITYNIFGDWLLILDGNIFSQEYLEQHDFSIVNHINNENSRLIQFIKDTAIEQYENHHKIVEIKNDEYWQPSSIISISDVRPYKKETIDLSPYWNMNQGYEDLTVYDVKVTNENINDSELVDINYINGKATIRSRQSDVEYKVPFKYLNGDIDVSDEMTLNNTFNSKYIINNL